VLLFLKKKQEARIRYGTNFSALEFICTYSLINQAEKHYEETNGASFHIVRDYIKAVERLVKK